MAKKDERDRRDYQKDRRRTAARERSGPENPLRGDGRSSSGQRARDEAKENQGYTKSEDKDLQSPPGGTQREVWVKDNDNDNRSD